MTLLLDEAFAREGGRCFYCDRVCTSERRAKPPYPRNMASRDHLVPQFYGGSDDIENVVMACIECNNARGLMFYVDFLIGTWARFYATGTVPAEAPARPALAARIGAGRQGVAR